MDVVTPHELHCKIKRLGVPVHSTSGHRDRTYLVAIEVVACNPSSDDVLQQIRSIDGVVEVSQVQTSGSSSGLLYVTVAQANIAARASPAAG
ncbi:hypothetical protein [Kineosporia sp. NBRC 101677]|uniref:hypothetical protein n=1 Tax=Kineosporia sp. NBRC 101677 TaxID=3032197 RepID=UPI0025542195|nr:hypothetical protein [Kineosporia sp. NBRC 101677]